MLEAPGTEDSAYLAFRLVNRLAKLLVSKGAITPEEMVALLDKLASDMGKDRRAVAQRNIRYVQNAMIPEHKVVE